MSDFLSTIRIFSIRGFATAFLAALIVVIVPVEAAQAQLTPRQRYSLYYEAFVANDYDTAMPHLRWLLENEPLFTGRTPDDRNMQRAIVIHDSLSARALRAGDDATARAHVDSALAIFDQIPSTLEDSEVSFTEMDEFRLTINRGNFIRRHGTLLADLQDEVFPAYRRAFEIYPDSLDDFYLNEIARARYEEIPAESDGDQRRVARADLEALLEFATDAAYIEALVAAVPPPSLGEQLEELRLEYRAGASLDDEAYLQLYQYARIIDDRALLADLRDTIIRINPTPQAFMALAQQACRENRFAECFEHYEMAAELSSDNSQRRDIYYNMASVRSSQGRSNEAMRLANQALRYDSGHPPSLYIRAAAIAGTIRGGSLQARFGYWYAADLFNQVANAASSRGMGELASAARTAASRYNASGPSRDEYFFQGYRPGQTVTVRHGYGTATTTIR
ncbi:hypothetical protein BH23BAC4_BH23BAC4_16170 [soil metagenome]